MLVQRKDHCLLTCRALSGALFHCFFSSVGGAIADMMMSAVSAYPMLPEQPMGGGGGAEALLLSLPSTPSLSQSLSFVPTSSVTAAAVAAAPSDCFCGSGTNTGSSSSSSSGSAVPMSSFSISSSQRSFCDCHVVAASDGIDVGGRKISLPYGASGAQSSKGQAIGGGSSASAVDAGNSIQKSSRIAGSGLRAHPRSAGISSRATEGLLGRQDSKGSSSSSNTMGITSRITVASGLLMCRRSPKSGGSTGGNSSSSSSVTTCKQFRCEYCQFSCSWPYDLKLHLKQKHGIHKKSL